MCKMRHYYILCMFSFSFVVGYIPDEQRLMEVMFRTYEPASRPVYNASHVVLVKFGITLTQISDMVSYLFYSVFFSRYQR
jgi:hypothetical protein